MIPVESLIYKSRQRSNKLASNAHQEIPIEDLILIIREAQIKLVKQKFPPKGSKNYQGLEILIEPAEKHKLTPKEVNEHLNRWEADLSGLEPQMLFYIDSYLLCDKGECKNNIVWVNQDLVGHASITTLLQNANYRPSFEYQETFCDETQNALGFYTDGTFTPKEVYLSYLRYPAPVDIEGYEDFDGNLSKTVHCELPLHLEDELLDIITQDIAQYTENPSAYQASLQSRSLNA